MHPQIKEFWEKRKWALWVEEEMDGEFCFDNYGIVKYTTEIVAVDDSDEYRGEMGIVAIRRTKDSQLEYCYENDLYSEEEMLSLIQLTAFE